VTKADIINKIAKETGLSKMDTEVVVDGFLSTIMEALHEGKRVDFRGFGNFSLKIRKPKIARNPGTGMEIKLPERTVPFFKPSKLFKDSIIKKFNN